MLAVSQVTRGPAPADRHRLNVDRFTFSKAETSAVVSSSGTSRTAAAFMINSCPPMLGPPKSAGAPLLPFTGSSLVLLAVPIQPRPYPRRHPIASPVDNEKPSWPHGN